MIECKKGDKVILKGFTGIKLGVFEIASANKKTVTINKKNGDELIFDRKSGRQVNVEEGKEKYANSIMEDDGSFVAPTRAKKTEKPSKKTEKPEKKSSKKKQPEPEPEDEDDDFEEVE